MNENIPNDELLSAYLDGELTAEQQAQVDALLASDEDAQRTVDELRAISQRMQELPRYKLEADFAERVLLRAERETLVSGENGQQITAATQPVDDAAFATTSKSPTGINWRRLIWAGATIAAAVTIMAYYSRQNQDVAQPNADDAVVHAKRDQDKDANGDRKLHEGRADLRREKQNSIAGEKTGDGESNNSVASRKRAGEGDRFSGSGFADNGQSISELQEVSRRLGIDGPLVVAFEMTREEWESGELLKVLAMNDAKFLADADGYDDSNAGVDLAGRRLVLELPADAVALAKTEANRGYALETSPQAAEAIVRKIKAQEAKYKRVAVQYGLALPGQSGAEALFFGEGKTADESRQRYLHVQEDAKTLETSDTVRRDVAGDARDDSDLADELEAASKDKNADAKLSEDHGKRRSTNSATKNDGGHSDDRSNRRGAAGSVDEQDGQADEPPQPKSAFRDRPKSDADTEPSSNASQNKPSAAKSDDRKKESANELKSDQTTRSDVRSPQDGKPTAPNDAPADFSKPHPTPAADKPGDGADPVFQSARPPEPDDDSASADPATSGRSVVDAEDSLREKTPIRGRDKKGYEDMTPDAAAAGARDGAESDSYTGQQASRGQDPKMSRRNLEPAPEGERYASKSGSVRVLVLIRVTDSAEAKPAENAAADPSVDE